MAKENSDKVSDEISDDQIYKSPYKRQKTDKELERPSKIPEAYSNRNIVSASTGLR